MDQGLTPKVATGGPSEAKVKPVIEPPRDPVEYVTKF
jgi:hypothetical protein